MAPVRPVLALPRSAVGCRRAHVDTNSRKAAPTRKGRVDFMREAIKPCYVLPRRRHELGRAGLALRPAAGHGLQPDDRSFCARAEGDVFERIAAQVSSVVMNYAISRRRAWRDMENNDCISGDGEQDAVHVRLAARRAVDGPRRETSCSSMASAQQSGGLQREGGRPAGAETSVSRFLRHAR
jgi:hypothetical protein